MTYFKIFNEKDCHHNFQYQNGFNTDTNNFEADPDKTCCPGGLYFADGYNILGFLRYGNFIREVEIPRNETNVVHFKNKIRSKSLFLFPKRDLRDVETWKWLISKGVDIFSYKNFAIRWASEEGLYDIVKLLIERGADINATKCQPLRYAICMGHYEIVRLLIQKGADIGCIDEITKREGSSKIIELIEKTKKERSSEKNS
jgi:hypothetical protein